MALPIYLTTEAGDYLVTEAGDRLIGERSLDPYEGYNIFDMVPNWVAEPTQVVARNMTILENKTGLPTVRSHTASPVEAIKFVYTLNGRQEINDFRNWLTALKGIQVPVWIPTGMEDLVPTQDLSGTSLVVESIGYEDNLFGHNARKHLAIIAHDGTIYTRGVTAAVDNGTTETLTINSSLGTTLAKKHTKISFLILARLNKDKVEIEWITHDLAEAELMFIEVPREVPAP